MITLKEKISQVFHQRDGRLTQELALASSALGKLPKRLMPEATTDLICGFCSTGCSLTAHLQGNQAVNLTPTQNYPVNRGSACPKGWEALTPLKASDRAVTPYARDHRTGKLVPTDWESALCLFVEKFKEILEKHGQESVAFLSTGQFCTEEMAFLGVLTKFGMGLIHGDSNTRQCMATSAVAYKQSFGFDAPPYTYKDFEESDVLVFIGANPCIAHPIMWERVCRNPHHPQIIVLDPRKTETAMAATRHYAILPKSDLTLFYGLAYLLIENNWINRSYIEKHTSGFEQFREHVQSFTPQKVAEVTGLSLDQLKEFASLIYLGKRVSFWWTMGVNQGYEAVRTAQAIINLALMTGNMGRPGTGANSITGQCNAMGSRLFSNTTNLLGGRDFLNSQDRQDVAEILRIDPSGIPTQNSWAYDQIIDGILMGKIKGLWVIATNPSHSWINQTEFNEIVKKLDFLVVQDMYYSTDTAQIADLILPAAGWGEKDGTVINSERRIGLFKKVMKAPGRALADFYIFKLIAEYWGCGKMFEDWSSPENVFQILKKLSKGQPYDITGIKDYRMIEDNGGIQWPFPPDGPLDQERRLFEDGNYFHPDQKARFICENVRDIPEPTDDVYPFILLTGRGSSSQWHTETRTGKSLVLRKMHSKNPYVEINPKDAAKLNVRQKQWVYVTTKRACVRVQSFVVPTIRPGQIFMPMHYPQTNKLTFAAFDPYSRQPSYKICAARVAHTPYIN